MKEHSKETHVIANLHTHTIFCDGKASAEEMIQAALSAGLSIIGFSGHSMYPFSTDWNIPVRDHAPYAEEIRRLQLDYADRIRVQLGFEADYIPGICTPRFDRYAAFAPDYLIGSVHYIGDDKGVFTVDNTHEELLSGIARCYAGNAKAAVSDYFCREREMLSRGDFTFIGHADLVRKFNGALQLFDEEDGWYKREVEETARAIAQAGVFAEH